VHYREYALDHGVPAQDVIVEPRATNTAENFIYTRELLSERLPISSGVYFVRRPWPPRQPARSLGQPGWHLAKVILAE
jgi:hypothetical protein